MMEQKQLLEILKVASKLKVNTRHNWTDGERKESVADHSWRISLMAMLLMDEEEFRNLDMNKVIQMCLIHDLGEAFTGDIPTFLKTDNDEEKEDEILLSWIHTFPQETKQRWLGLYEEMKEMQTLEAKTYKALDKLEAVISHNEADINSWLPLEKDLQLTYAVENTKFSAYLSKLREEVDTWTKNKIKAESSQL